MKNHVNIDNMVAIMGKCNDNKINSRRVSDGCEKVIYIYYISY